MAVISVTINRVNDDRFPNTICGVVRQGPHRPSWKGTGEMIPIRHKCQFSWYCDGKPDTVYDEETFEEIYVLTDGVVDGTFEILDITEGATHYQTMCKNYKNKAKRLRLRITYSIDGIGNV